MRERSLNTGASRKMGQAPRLSLQSRALKDTHTHTETETQRHTFAKVAGCSGGSFTFLAQLVQSRWVGPSH